MRKYKSRHLRTDQLVIDPHHPRKDYGTSEEMSQLLSSIKEHSVLRAIDVMQIDENTYAIIDGQRRHWCALKLKIESVPCNVYPKMSRGELELLRLNLQRDDW